jgi:hypothetical protein
MNVVERLALNSAALVVAVIVLLASCIAQAPARDDGKFTGAPLKAWFDKLRSDKGLCCSFAAGKSIADVDWGAHEDHYWVILDGMRYPVPPEAVVTDPNKFGPAVVWPYQDTDGKTQIRCFLPGAGA